MDTPMLEYVIAQLDARKGRLPEIAAEVGMSYRTLQKIHQRVVRNPGVASVQKLHDYFRSAEDCAA